MDLSDILTLVFSGVVAAAAVVSVAIACRKHRAAAEIYREQREGEVMQLRERVETSGSHVVRLGKKLALAHQASATFLGATTGSRLAVLRREIQGKIEDVQSMQESAQRLRGLDLPSLSDEQINAHITQLRGHVVRLDEIRDGFARDLTFAESENRQRREEAFRG